MGVSLISTISVDLPGRKMVGAVAQALIFSVLLDMAGSPWPIVFLVMAATRLISAAIINRVRV